MGVTVDPLDDGTRSQVTIELDFEGHGIGKVLAPLLVRRQAGDVSLVSRDIGLI